MLRDDEAVDVRLIPVISVIVMIVDVDIDVRPVDVVHM
jgi:hypothetical protein